MQFDSFCFVYSSRLVLNSRNFLVLLLVGLTTSVSLSMAFVLVLVNVLIVQCGNVHALSVVLTLILVLVSDAVVEKERVGQSSAEVLERDSQASPGCRMSGCQ